MIYIFNKFSLFVIFCSIIFSTFANNLSDPKILKLALLPDENAASIIQDNKALVDLLKRKLNKEIDIVVTTDYSSMIEGIRFKRIHIGYFGPLSYTIAKLKTNITPFAVRVKNGQTKYRSVIIGNKLDGIEDFEDMRGGDFGFGDIASTSGHLIPKKILLENNLLKGKDFNEVFLGAHDAVAIATQNGVIQAGGLSEPILKKLIKNGTLNESKINIIAYSNFYPQYPWVYIDELDKDLKKKISTVFYNINDKKILEKFEADGFSKIIDSDYDVIRELAKKLKIYDFK